MADVRIVDSSLLIEAERRRALDDLESYFRSGPKTIAPPAVFEETVTEPKSIARFVSSASRIEKLYTNTVVIEEPDYSSNPVSDVVDKVRKCIAKKAKKDEHLIELADLQIVALAVSYAIKGRTVELIFRDKALKDCLKSVLDAQAISGVSVTDSSALIHDLIRKVRSR